MNKVYLVKSREFDCYPSIEKAFSNKIKAQAYIDGKMSTICQIPRKKCFCDINSHRINDAFSHKKGLSRFSRKKN